MDFIPDGTKPPCVGLTKLFYVGEDKVREVAKAKAICHQCQYRVPCLVYAIVNSEPFGIFGGLTVSERALGYLLLEQLDPLTYSSLRSTLREPTHQDYAVPSSHEHTLHLTFRSRSVSESSLGVQVVVEVSRDIEIALHQSGEAQSPCPPHESSYELLAG